MRKFFAKKWVRITGIALALVILCGAFFLLGKHQLVVSSASVVPKPVTPAPLNVPPVSRPASVNVVVNPLVVVTQTVNGVTENQSSQTLPPKPAAPTPAPSLNQTPALTPAPTQTPTPTLIAPQLLIGDFKATIYRLSDNWATDTFTGEPTIDTSTGPLSRTDNVSVRWTGSFSVQSAGEYQFSSNSTNDLYIDEKRIVAPVYLSAGTHKLIFGPCFKSAGGSIRLMWQKIR